MADNALLELASTKGAPLVVDGAMGTQLFAAGLESGDAPERWNLTNPDAIAAVHQSYVDAGADIIVTNSFGGTAFRLKLHELDDQVREINAAAARIARGVADGAGRPVLVAGSMGPTGELLEPMGALTKDAAIAAFADQAAGLTEGGADVLWIETMSDLDEAECALRGAQQASDLPVVVTFSFDTAGRTMMGVTGTAAAERLVPLGVTALGANCGNNLTDTEAAIAQMRAVDPNVLIVSKANAGIPEWKGDALEYNGTPEVLGAHADRVHTAGANIVGACCGSSPDHIAMMAKVLDGSVPVPEVELQEGSTPASSEGRTRRRGRSRSE